jgi:hypothetical protein
MLIVFIFFATYHRPANKTPKSTQISPETVPKAATTSPSWLSWQHLGDSWAQLAAKLALTAALGRHLGANLAQHRPKCIKKRTLK